MPYALFFYNYALILITVVAFTGFCALAVRHRRHVYRHIATLFGLYLVDITFLWMMESIPEFKASVIGARESMPYTYTLFSTAMLLTYRAILGDLLDTPISNHEAAIWVLCFVGILAEGEVKNDLYRIAAELVFPAALRIWTIAGALWMNIRTRGLVEQKRSRFALGLCTVYCLAEIANLALPSPDARSIPFEVMGLMFTLIGIAYLVLRVRGVQQATRDLQPIAFANRYGLTRREEELLCLLVAGRTNREIGEELTISIGTVKTHVHHIYEKVGVSSREELRDRMQTETIGAKSTE